MICEYSVIYMVLYMFLMYVYKTDVATILCLRPRQMMEVLRTSSGLVSEQGVREASYGVICQEEMVVCGVAHVTIDEGVHVIGGICTKASHRHQGVGALMLELLTHELQGASARTLIRCDNQSHDRVVSFYETRNFRVSSRSHTHTNLEFCQ